MLSIAQLIARENRAMGPFEISGGIVHALSEAEIVQTADEIAKAPDAFGTRLAILCAIIRGESVFDPLCVDPNLQDAPGAMHISGVCVKGGTWPDAGTQQAHTDFGIAQINGDSSYLGFSEVGRSLQWMCKKLNDCMQSALMFGYNLTVALEGYNKGFDGAVTLYHKYGLDLKVFDYGHTAAERVTEYTQEGLY